MSSEVITKSEQTASNNAVYPLDRIPPQSLDAEQAVLGGLLVDPDAILKVVEILKPNDFYRTAHREIYHAITTLFNKTEPVDIVTVSQELENQGQLELAGGRSYINELAIAVTTTENVAYYSRIIHDKAILRSLIQIGTQIVYEAYEEVDADIAIDNAEQLIFKLVQQGGNEDLVALSDVLPTTYEQIEERYNNRGSLLGVSSGFRDLDVMTSGFQKSDLIIVAARPSMGKTAFCLNIASHAAVQEKRPVLIFSLEMSKEQLAQRMICSEAEIDAQRIRTGEMNPLDFQKISAAMGSLGDSPVFIDDTPAISLMALRAKARKLKMERGDLGLIIIDYLQLMEYREAAGSKGDNRVQEISAISRGLKNIARELKVPVIALSQLSRAVESRQEKKPMLSDLRESGSIEQDADLVIFLYRDEYYTKELSEKPGIASVIISKQRNGPVGEVELLFQGNITRFKPLHQMNQNIF